MAGMTMFLQHSTMLGPCDEALPSCYLYVRISELASLCRVTYKAELEVQWFAERIPLCTPGKP